MNDDNISVLRGGKKDDTWKRKWVKRITSFVLLWGPVFLFPDLWGYPLSFLMGIVCVCGVTVWAVYEDYDKAIEAGELLIKMGKERKWSIPPKDRGE